MKRIIEKLILTVVFIMFLPFVWACGAFFGIMSLTQIEFEEIKGVWKNEG